MANFYLKESEVYLEDSHIYVAENETSCQVVWENLKIENGPMNVSFTFTATLQKNGEILFVYHKVPVGINTLDEIRHPVKVGLSDAYIVQSQIHPRKTIYEYARVGVEKKGITDGTIIRLKPLPTCQIFKDCQSCLNHDKCNWCKAVSRCSTRDGLDRGKHEWHSNGCKAHAISLENTCPVKEHISPTQAPECISSTQATKHISSTQVPDSTTYETTYQSSTAIPETIEGSTMANLNHNPIETIKQCVKQCLTIV